SSRGRSPTTSRCGRSSPSAPRPDTTAGRSSLFPDAHAHHRPGGEMIVDCAVYERGVRQPGEQMSLEEAAGSPRRGNNYVWIELLEPSPEDMSEVARHFGLHELAVEDAALAHQRPKVDTYDDFYFIVYRTAAYDEESRSVRFGELDLFLGTGYVIAVRHGDAG